MKSTHLHSTPSPIRSSMVCRAKIGGRLGGPVGPSAAAWWASASTKHGDGGDDDYDFD